ncbi:MAG: PA0069 family radical SAM protein [Alphaproteobacteria bacterium]|nr:PA0069 family radical SAM protein [Alphaproteobacteria bacterium]
MDILPDLPGGQPLKGRGAVSNRTGRFEREVRHRIDDGWSNAGRGGGTPPDPTDTATVEEVRPRTHVIVDATRSALTRNTSPDIPFDRSINPYRGCEHGCVYCFARPTHAYLGMSPGLDFETRILAKPDAPRLLVRELSRRNYRCRPIAMGTNTDPYQPLERRLHITRGILRVLSDFNHPVSIVTKSDGVLADLDLLADMAARNLAKVYLSVTTLDGGLARRLEPRAAAPAKRLAAVHALAEAGVPVGVMVAPVIPALTDTEMESILEAAAGAGAREAGYILLRLPLEVKDLFTEWLRVHYPDRAARVLSLVRDTRGGNLNDATFGRRMRGQGPYAALIAARFNVAARRVGLINERAREGMTGLDCTRFAPPKTPARQLALFEE